ncbi:MAG TPA: PadR family transcriptional regulator [Longimicrobiales bacterium]|nr:PadR family transcriptional regulator [Longimicrobiales bacterium]
MSRKKTDLLQGSLDMLILKTLSVEGLHGWGISKRIRDWSSGVLEVNQGSLYPALYRLERRRLIVSEWGVSEHGRRARLYRLTAAGRSRLEAERAGWRRFSGAVEAILSTG